MKLAISFLLTMLCCLSTITSVLAKEVTINTQLLSTLTSYKGETIERKKDKITHLVFIDVWRAYSGQGDDKVVAALPKRYLQQSQQVWVQPEINVTKPQLAEFQQYLPHISPLVLDTKFELMRSLNIWSSPYHVLVKGNEQLFSGDATALTNFVSQHFATADEKLDHQKKLTAQIESDNIAKVQVNKKSAVKTAQKPHKPLAGDVAPQFSTQTMLGEAVSLTSSLKKLQDNKPLNLVFLDALCPMPQFPGCEQKIADLNKLIKADANQQWLAVVNSYYVNEDYVKDFVANFELTLPILFDTNNTIYRAYDVYASPYLIKVNRNGKILSRSDQIN